MNRTHLSIIYFFVLFLNPVIANSQTAGQISDSREIHVDPVVNAAPSFAQRRLPASETPVALYGRLVGRFKGGKSLPPLAQVVPPVQTSSVDPPTDPADTPLPPAVAAALDAMKARIAEL